MEIDKRTHWWRPEDDVGDAFVHSLSWNAATFDGRSTETEREFFLTATVYSAVFV